MKWILLTAAGLAACFAAPVVARDTDAQIKSRIIRESIASYPGNCPCPYNSARNGSRCGGRSAYNRGGGYAPLCFPADVGRAEVDAYRRRTGR
ncbi:hypothetical protein NTCA1_43080 [Novosphingobium sp. TCA1]|nr:hypothetical protein NTCA1_43080 [Novosphingobium sp. TCA1]